MTQEEQIKKAWESAYKDLAGNLDKEVSKEEYALMLFELGWKKGVEEYNSGIAAAISVLSKINKKKS